MKKSASILDYSYPGISPDIWLSDGTLNPVHKDFIIKLLTSFYNSYGLKSPEQWVIDVTVIGSLTTNRYIRTSDFDCHVIVDIDKFIATNMPNASKEEAIAYLDNARKTWDRAKILMPFGEHCMELYIEDPNLNPSNTENVGRYSTVQNKWLKPPIYFAQDLDFEISRKEAIEGAKALANELDDSFGEIGRQIQRIDELKEVLQAWPEEKRQLYYAKVQNKLDIIEEQLEKSIQIKQDLVDTRHLKQDAFSENEIQFKFLARFHYFSILSNLKTLLEQTGGQVTTQELPLIEKIISQGSVKEASNLSYAYWVDPQGKIYTVRPDESSKDLFTHSDWVVANQDLLKEQYGLTLDLNCFKIIEEMYTAGWARVGDSRTSGSGYGITVGLLDFIPNGVDAALAQFYQGGELIVEEEFESRRAVAIDDPFPNLQKAVNKALQRKRMGSINKDAAMGYGMWMSPTGELIDVSSHPDYAFDNAKELGLKNIPEVITDENGGEVYASLMEQMFEKGWVRFRWTSSEMNVELYDLQAIPDKVNDFIIEYPTKTIRVANAWGDDVTVDYDSVIQDGIQKAVNLRHEPEELENVTSIKQASSNVRDIDGVRVYRNPTPEQATNLFRQSKEECLRYIATEAGDIYVWDAFFVEHSKMAEDIGLTDDPNWYDGAGTFVTEEQARNKAQVFSRCKASMKEAFLKEAFEKETETDICVDFDKTIAKPAKHPAIGDPIEGAKESLKKLQDMGYSVVIYSCRADTEEGLDAIREYLDKHDLPYDSIFEGDKPSAKFYIDDKAIHFDSWDNVIKQVEKTEKKASLYIIAAPLNLPVIDPKTFKRTEPYALFIGTQWNAKHTVGVDLFNIYPMINADNGVPTVGLQTLVDKSIPIIGKEPRAGDKQPAQDISGLYKQAFSKKEITAKTSSNAWIMDPKGKLYPVVEDDHEATAQKITGKSIYDLLPLGWATIRTIGNNVAIAVDKLNRIPSTVDDYLAKNHFKTIGIIPADANLEGLPEPPRVDYEDAIEHGIQKAINRDIMRMRNMSKTAQTKKVKQGDYSCLMALVPHDLAQEIVEWGVRNVPDEDLYLDEDGNLGRELESHITIKYGLLTNDAKPVRRSFNNEKPFKAKLGKVRHFQPPELPFDVLTVEIISKDLEKANKKICDNFDCAEGLVSDEYHPHITIAYMKRDSAEEYIGSDDFEGKEVELDTVIFSPHKGNRTYFSISQDKESSFILEYINKFADFLPSMAENAPTNNWQFAGGGDDVEICEQPDPVSDEETFYAPCTVDKPRTKEVWRQFISMFSNLFSKKDTVKIESYDKELEQEEKDALGEDQTLLEYSKGFYDSKKHDFPHNTTWDSLTQDGEPSKPTSVTYSPQSNEDNLDQNSPGGYPRRFMGKPKGEWFSNEGEANNALINMLKNQTAAIDSMTRDITAGYSMPGYWIDPAGKIYTVRDAGGNDTHFDWINKNKDLLEQQYGLRFDPGDRNNFGNSLGINNLLDAGWTRVGDSASGYIGIEVPSFEKLPAAAIDSILDTMNQGKGIIVEDNFGKSVEIDWTKKVYDGNIQKAVNKALQRKRLGSVIDSMTRDITASIEEINGVPVFVNPSAQELEGLSRNLKGGHMFRGLLDPHTGDLFVWDAYEAIHQFMIQQLGLDVKYSEESPYCLYFPPGDISYILHDQQKVRQGTKLQEPVIAKQAGDQSASVPDYLIDEWKTDQLHDDISEEPYVNHDQRDYPYGMHDSPENTGYNIGWAKDNQPAVVRLDQLDNPNYRDNPFNMTEYWVTYYNSMPMSDGIEQGNPE